jgi:MutS domain V
VEFIKNDCRLERGASWFQVITGPNMGGKSTYIRQVRACSAAAPADCLVSICISTRQILRATCQSACTS